MDTEEAKYTRIEYKRSFLMLPLADWQGEAESYSKTHEDKYLRQTRLRLRIQTDSDTGRRLIKLHKKSESTSPYFRSVSRVLLSESECQALEALAGNRLNKTRYYHHYRGQAFSIDVYRGELEGLLLCKVETTGLKELMKLEPPEYAKWEVTRDAFFTGGNLCRTTQAELLAKLSTFG
jgi:CYTH domain-containing protein